LQQIKFSMKQFLFSIYARRIFYLVSFVLGLLLLCSAIVLDTAYKKTSAVSKPNIIIMLVDDAGYADFGFMGSKDLLTPNLDKLAAQSIRFLDAHVTASVCSPSRAGLLTGKYQQRFGYECNEGDGYTGMDTTQTILPKFLQQLGYTTAAFGKWHLGFEPGQHPLKKGFQYYYGFLSGGRSYFYNANKDDQKGVKTALMENHQQVKFDGYLTDVLGDKAVGYIKQNKHHPFFMYWAPNAVHTPMEATKADLEKFANHPRQKLAAMTFALDRAIGKIVDELKKQGLFENTMIAFLSDNGGANNNQSSNLPLKGFKGNKYEGGHRIPFFISWPKGIPGGTTFEGLSSSLDILPTALAAAGGSAHSVYGLNGVNLLPFLKEEKQANPHQQLVWRKDGAAAIRYNQYKLIRIFGAGERLYDLSKDPGETNNLQFAQPETFSTLKEKLINWENDKMKPLWTEGAVWDTITLMIHDDLMHNRKVRVYNPEDLQKFRLIKHP
jgi:arylsulfatase A-like enzyme